MKKIIILIITSVLIFLNFGSLAFADPLDLQWDAKWWVNKWNQQYLDDAKEWWDQNTFNTSLFWYFNFFWWAETWQKWAKWMLFTIARNLKDALIAFSVIYMFILALRLFFWQWTDDDMKKWRIGVLWTTIWIVFMQMSYVAAVSIYNKNIWIASAQDLSNAVLLPVIRLLEVVTSFIFMAMAIMAFYRIVSSWWNDDWYKKWISSVINAIIWFILVKISAALVYGIYWKAECNTTFAWQVCDSWSLWTPNLTATAKIITSIIKYLTWFVSIVTIILIIYAGFMIITSSWDETKVKKWKSIIKYIVIWLIIITSSAILFNFITGRELGWIVGSYK